jgi:hypothetical protein
LSIAKRHQIASFFELSFSLFDEAPNVLLEAFEALTSREELNDDWTEEGYKRVLVGYLALRLGGSSTPASDTALGECARRLPLFQRSAVWLEHSPRHGPREVSGSVRRVARACFDDGGEENGQLDFIVGKLLAHGSAHQSAQSLACTLPKLDHCLQAALKARKLQARALDSEQERSTAATKQRFDDLLAAARSSQSKAVTAAILQFRECDVDARQLAAMTAGESVLAMLQSLIKKRLIWSKVCPEMMVQNAVESAMTPSD